MSANTQPSVPTGPDGPLTVHSFYDLFDALTYINRGERNAFQADPELLRPIQSFLSEYVGFEEWIEYLAKCAIPSSDFEQDPEIALWCILMLNDLQSGIRQFGKIVSGLLEMSEA